MEKELMKNLNKISFFNNKIKSIEESLGKNDYKNTYKKIAALIEITCILLLEKEYKESIEDSQIIVLINILEEHKENKLVDILIEINGIYNSIELNDISAMQIKILIGYLDEIVGIILEKHGNIFK